MPSALFDEIPEREPLPPMGGEGFGVSQSDLDIVKPAEIVGSQIAVVGFIIQDNKYKETDDDPDKVVLYECMDTEGNYFGFWHTSGVLRHQVESRWERDEIPFRTVLEKVPSKKAGRQPYYSFA
jgi:hypothetical protein